MARRSKGSNGKGSLATVARGRLSPPRAWPDFRRFERAVDRHHLVAACEGTADNRVAALAGMLTNLDFRGHSLGALCKKAGLTLHELHDLFRRYQFDIGLIRAYKHVPQALEDTFRDARSRLKVCIRCDGTGKVEKNKCIECNGKGKVRVPGHDKARDLLFRSGGLIQSGPLVANQINIDTGDSLEDVMGKAERALDVNVGVKDGES